MHGAVCGLLVHSFISFIVVIVISHLTRDRHVIQSRDITYLIYSYPGWSLASRKDNQDNSEDI